MYTINPIFKIYIRQSISILYCLSSHFFQTKISPLFLTMASKLCCNQCSYETNLPNKLYSHKISVHGYTCSECDFTTIFKRDLQRHFISIHQEKTLTCTECNFTAPDNDELFLHFKEKHNKINYQCKYCSYHTHWRTNLYKHVKKNHVNKNES